jgi:recombination protein RecA
MDIMFGKGISAVGSLLDAAVKYDVIDKKGAWFAYGEEKIGQGRDNTKEFMEGNPNFVKEVEEKLRKIMFPGKDFSEHKPGPAHAAKPAALPEGATPPEEGPAEPPVKSEPEHGQAPARGPGRPRKVVPTADEDSKNNPEQEDGSDYTDDGDGLF